MKVLVTGAGGFLGRYLVHQLIQRGHTVRIILRPETPHPEGNDAVEVFHANLELHDLEAAFNGIDAVLHLAIATIGDERSQVVSTVVATERLLEAMVKTKVKRLVHVSSLAVYDWSKTRKVLNEQTPLLNDASELSAYTIAKANQERIVTQFAKDHSLDITIARPGFIWGRHHAKVAGMGRHWGPFYIMFGPLTRLPLTHVLNCADCLVTMLEKSAAIGEAFNIIDEDNIRVWRYVWEYAWQTAQPGLPVLIPYQLALAAIQFARRLIQTMQRTHAKQPSLLVPRRFESQFKPLRFSNQKLHKLLNWRAPLDFKECLTQTYGWARNATR